MCVAGENLKEFFYDSFEGWYVLSGSSRRVEVPALPNCACVARYIESKYQGNRMSYTCEASARYKQVRAFARENSVKSRS